jgi:ribonuclease D
MVSARIAGKKEIGLASLLQKHLHVTLDKKLQRSDWGRRPLSSAQYEYAAKDTHYLIRLREILHHELVRMGRLEEALEQFELLGDYEVPDKPFDPEAYRRFKGARELDPQRLAVLRELTLYREDRARAINRPVFMVLPELLLVRLAQSAPADHDQLKRVTGVTSFILSRHGKGILDAVARGREAAPVSALAPQPRQVWTGKQMARYERLRAWRAAKAAERGVDPDVVVPNKALKAMSLIDEASAEVVGAVDGMSPHKMSLYWPDLEAILRSKSPNK